VRSRSRRPPKQLGTGGKPVSGARMGHAKGKDNVKRRAARRKKTERLQAAKTAKKTA
jgi:hypothetical protein